MAMTSDAKPGTWEDAVIWLRNQPQYGDLVRESYYDDPLPASAERYWKSAEWTAVRPLLGDDRGRALDVGAGRGIASYALAKEGFAVSALEPDPSALVGAEAIRDLARSQSLSIAVSENHSERLPFEDGCFDLVFVRAALHHTSDLPAACREFHRVLKLGGRIVAIREHVISRREHLAAFLASHPLHALYGGENAFLLGEYLSALQSAGFSSIETIAPLQSAINYFPQTRDSLRTELIARAGRFPGGGMLMRNLVQSEPGLDMVLRVAGLIDRRPGRLYSFMGFKR